MEITFLGTSSGAPTKQRNVSGIALKESKGKDWILIDCGEATQHQLLHCSLSINHLKAILISHIHGDHCYGLPGILASAAMGGRTAPLILVAPKAIWSWIEATIAHTQLYLPYEVQFTEVESLPHFDCGQFSISTITLSHRVESYGFAFVEQNIDKSLDMEAVTAMGIPRGPLWGEIIKQDHIEFEGRTISTDELSHIAYPPRRVLICGDNDNPQLLDDVATDFDVVVHESTYTSAFSHQAKEHGHCTADEIAKAAQRLSVKNLALTHFSARFQLEGLSKNNIEEIRVEAQNHYQGKVYLARDLETYFLPAKGERALEPVEQNRVSRRK